MKLFKEFADFLKEYKVVGLAVAFVMGLAFVTEIEIHAHSHPRSEVDTGCTLGAIAVAGTLVRASRVVTEIALTIRVLTTNIAEFSGTTTGTHDAHHVVSAVAVLLAGHQAISPARNLGADILVRADGLICSAIV